MQKIRKAVFPVAGLGTRFLPATKASPKEMLPVVDKPLIQYAVEEALDAGIEQMIFITSSSKRSIADHFDRNPVLEQELEQRGKFDLLDMARHTIPEGVSCIYIRQPEPLGLGHAVLCARPAVGDEPFAVILADDLIDGGEQSCLGQMVDLYAKHEASILAIQEVAEEETSKYGIIDPQTLYERVHQLRNIVEKPTPLDAPSCLAVVGRYLLTPNIFDYLEKIPKGAGGELQLTDAIARQLKDHPVLAQEFQGKRYDCGSKLGYLEATVEYALQHQNLREAFKKYLNSLLHEQKI
ncbi:UTP--glucose-1-phosphate uridylyltransferase GalU [Candidatus Venteria ishoeyi]|uniref:UTP--glucose-1-phosphate uridylyltransferase GalU n=1 Tax=Candidatus Venteria ishoeyi TaxID=1899563 RepID=UPI0025A686A8|nr:UTP--glucose-1-phosphate uridylyltransferase GalU [Candidatus Venteria ishoeyi]MDM8546707.1 UTP--glucose-1-phosphate uridylyltransferase GalU [Candidatus Venteria ishoeyi]